MAIQRKSILGRQPGKCKGPGASACLACSGKRKVAHLMLCVVLTDRKAKGAHGKIK